MSDKSKTKAQLIMELNELRKRVTGLEELVTYSSPISQDINQTIIDASPAFFMIVDADGKVMMMNKSMLKGIGYIEK